jgi:hypothetical protein
MEGGPAGIYNIVDDELAEVSAWLPELARTIGAKLPYHVPVDRAPRDWRSGNVDDDEGPRLLE